MESKCSIVINRVSETEAERKGFYRFLNNKKVTPEEMIQIECSKSDKDYSGKHILVLGDTSALVLESHKGRLQDISSFGVVDDNKSLGIITHSNIAIDSENGQVLGLTDLLLWDRARNERKESKEEQRKTETLREYTEKESYKWLLGAINSKKVLDETKAKSITYVFDREADILDLMGGIRSQNLGDFVIRSNFDRRIESENRSVKISELLEKQSACGIYELEIPPLNHFSKTKGKLIQRKARLAKMEVKYVKAKIKIAKDEKIAVVIILAKELPETVPKGESPIEWRLLTSHEVNSFEEALEKVGYYTKRWIIEQLFRIVKKDGVNLASTELESKAAIYKLTVLTFSISIKLLYLVYAREDNSNILTTEVFDNEEIKVLSKLNKKLEGKTAKQKNPHKKQYISWAVWVIARSGGWKASPSARKPGPSTIVNGYRIFITFCNAFKILTEDG